MTSRLTPHSASETPKPLKAHSFKRRTFLRTAALTPLAATAVGGISIAMANGEEIPSNGETKIVDLDISTEHEAVVKVETEGASLEHPELEGEVAAQVSGYVTMVAASWAEENRPDAVEFQAVFADGSVGEWLTAHFIDAEENEVNATDPIWIGPSVAVNVRANRAGIDISENITLHLIATSEAANDAPLVSAGPAGGTHVIRRQVKTFAPGTNAPNIIARSQWGANEAISTWAPTPSNETRMVVLHHTVGSNNYSPTQSAQIVRGIYEYHAKTRQWGDIGYNVLVDKYGQIFEGRKGGVHLNIAGAHAAPFNTHTFGISLMGDYTNVPASDLALHAIAKIAAWKLRGVFVSGVHDTAQFTNVFHSGTRHRGTVTLPRFVGHRDVNYTACPGDYIYANQMAQIRTLIATYMDRTEASHFNAYNRAGGMNRLGTVLAIEQNTDNWQVTRLTGGIILTYGSRTSAHVTAYAKEWHSSWGRPLADVMRGDQAFERGTARLINGRVVFQASAIAAAPPQLSSVAVGRGWDPHNTISAGDFSKRGLHDLILRRPDHSLMLYPVSATGGWNKARLVGTGWRDFDVVIGGFDWDKDGNPDLIARHKPSGDLYLYPGNGRGGFNRGKKIGSGWNSLTHLSVIESYLNNRPALTAVDERGLLRLYLADGKGGFSRRIDTGYGWQSMRSLMGITDLNGDARGELLALTNNGNLRLYEAKGLSFRFAKEYTLDVPDSLTLVGAGKSKSFYTVTKSGALRRFEL